MEKTNQAVVFQDVSKSFGQVNAVRELNFNIEPGQLITLLGPSGCGKTTFLRCINRITERLDYVRTTGQIHVLGQDIYSPNVEIVQLRKSVGMVFQRPNPLPLSILENVLFGYRLHHPDRGRSVQEEEEIAEDSLKKVLLWNSVKDKLREPAISLSLEQQQKLCIARLLPVKPSVILLDEPCSALDPEATEAVEELLWNLREDYTILIVTHNMAQARRVSDESIFMLLGKVVEHSITAEMFVTPAAKETADYIEGRYG